MQLDAREKRLRGDREALLAQVKETRSRLEREEADAVARRNDERAAFDTELASERDALEAHTQRVQADLDRERAAIDDAAAAAAAAAQAREVADNERREDLVSRERALGEFEASLSEREVQLQAWLSDVERERNDLRQRGEAVTTEEQYAVFCAAFFAVRHFSANTRSSSLFSTPHPSTHPPTHIAPTHPHPVFAPMQGRCPTCGWRWRPAWSR